MLLANRGNVVAVEVGETHEQPIVGDTLVLLKNAGLANVDYLQHRLDLGQIGHRRADSASASNRCKGTPWAFARFWAISNVFSFLLSLVPHLPTVVK